MISIRNYIVKLKNFRFIKELCGILRIYKMRCNKRVIFWIKLSENVQKITKD